MRVVYHPDAEDELTEAALFYDKRVRGLGDSFLRAFGSAIAEIERQPERWPVVEGDLRCRSLRRFPYAVYYRAVGDELRILVVKHHKRHPDYWRYRLPDE
jgi:plasmid stabilization system protein ParE